MDPIELVATLWAFLLITQKLAAMQFVNCHDGMVALSRDLNVWLLLFQVSLNRLKSALDLKFRRLEKP